MDREEPGGLQSMGSQRVRHDLVLNHHQRYCGLDLTPAMGNPGEPEKRSPRTSALVS